MRITVKRYISDDETTLSRVYIDDVFECYGLEDEYRATKVRGETRIPDGNYDIRLRTGGGMHPKYAARFPGLHRGMLWLQDVPDFSYVYIHTGNLDEHTMGCLLVGGSVQETPGEMAIWGSREAYRNLYSKVVAEADAEGLSIEFIDLDRNAP